MNNYITTTQAAKQWGVNIGTIRMWLKRGKLQAEKFGRDWMIPADAPRPEDKRFVGNPIRNRRKERP